MTFLSTVFAILSITTLISAQGVCQCKGNVPVFLAATAYQTRARCIDDTCDLGYVCPRTIDQCATNTVDLSSNVLYRCNAVSLQFSASQVQCVRPSGVDDPHITGFDGTKFDFQGVPKKTYAIFGRVGGDLLVTRMRASGFRIHRPGVLKTKVLKTYFAEFGLTTEGPKVRVALVPKGKKRWTSRVFVDGKPITQEFKHKHAHISLLDKGSTVHVVTLETKYRFTVGGAKGDRSRHLNVDFELLKKPASTHKYVGVIGMTLNRAMGHNVHEGLGLSKEIQTSWRQYGKVSGIRKVEWNHEFELTMRRFFEVDELFPPNHKNVATLGGVVSRMLTSAKPIVDAVPLRMIASITE